MTDKEFVLKVILYCMFCNWKCARAETVTISSETCLHSFDFDSESFVGTDVTVLYKGDPAATTHEDGCFIKIYNWDSFQQDVCIDVESMNINKCTTNVTVYRGFISKYLDPSQSWSCNSPSGTTWCGGTRTSYLYIVVNSPYASGGDDVHLRVYRKDLPSDPEPSGTSPSYTSAIVSGVSFCILIPVLLIACLLAWRRRRQRMTNAPPVAFQATPYPVNGSNQPQYGAPTVGYSPYLPAPNTTPYQPAVSPSAPGFGGNAAIVQPNIYDANTAPPPSYDECVK